VTLNNLDFVMLGNLEPIIDALRQRDREERKNRALVF
jgi:protein subunit release factor A